MKTNEIKEKVTQQIIESLKVNQSLWTKAWTPCQPQNYENQKAYSGINKLILTLKTMNNGYHSPYWLTFKQLDNLDHSVIKGQKATMIVYYNLIDVKDKDVSEKTVKIKRFLF